MSDDSPARRTVLKAIFGGLSALIAAAVGGPIAVAFFDPARRRTVTHGEGPTELAKLAELTIGEPRKRDVLSAGIDAWDRTDAKPVGAVWLVRRDAARVDAYSVVCPHLGCAIGFDPAKKTFICPCHDSAFALKDGSRLKGPAPRGLDPLPIEVKDGKVMVTYQEFIQGITSRRKA